jgi:DNA replication protein DnaC
MDIDCTDCGQKFEGEYEDERRCPICLSKLIEEKKREEIKDRIERMIPAHFREIETDRQSDLKKFLGRSLYATGKYGTGKSVFLYSMAKFLLLNGEPIKIIRFPSWAMRMQSSFRNENANPFEDAQVIAGFRGTLLIDDLGAEKTTEYIRQLIYFILDEREQHDLITIITSNLSLKEVDELIDPRASSRISGMCDILIFKGEDRRLRKRI